MIEKIDHKNLLFVHIPKTSGTSILNKLDQSMWKKIMPAGHDPLFILENNNNIENSFSFCVVRNPYKRTYSYYHHFKKINNLQCSFLDFLNILKEKHYFKKTPMIVYPQSFYVYDSSGKIGIDKIYKYENLHKLEDDLNFKLDRLNVGNYNKNDYINDYKCSKCISLIQDLFSVDFFNFGYSLEEI